jgi:hypothetical protein
MEGFHKDYDWSGKAIVFGGLRGWVVYLGGVLTGAAALGLVWALAVWA